MAFEVVNEAGSSTKFVLTTDSNGKDYTLPGKTDAEITLSNTNATNVDTVINNTFDGYKFSNEINIGSAGTVAAAVQTIASYLNNNSSVKSLFNFSADNGKLKCTTKNDYGYTAETINKRDIKGLSSDAITVSVNSGTVTLTHNGTATISGNSRSVTLTGGVDYHAGSDGNAAVQATGTISIGVNDMVRFGGTTIRFVSGSGVTSPQLNQVVTANDMTEGTPPRTLLNPTSQTSGYVEVGVGASYSLSTGSFMVRFANGQLTVTTNTSTPSQYNGRSYGAASSANISFRYTTNETVNASEHEYSATSSPPLSTTQDATDGDYAHWDMDFSEYRGNTDLDDMEELIKDLRKIDIFIPYGGYYASFIDSSMSIGDDPSGNVKGRYSNTIDLNKLRSSVTGGKDIASSLIDLFTSIDTTSNDGVKRFSARTDGTVGVQVRAYNGGTRGNVEYVYAAERGEYSHYNVDFKKYFEDNPDIRLPEDLFGKGFMAYCATCPNLEDSNENNDEVQWFNFSFTGTVMEPPISEERPVVESDEDIKNITVDVSNVTDYQSLVKAIYDQGEPVMKSIDHYMHLSSDPNNGILTLYDNRNNLTNWPGYQTPYGAKIMDGYRDNVIPHYEDYYGDVQETVHHLLATTEKEDRLTIQHTDKSSQNITLHIPRTRIDSIFKRYFDSYPENKQDIFEYNLASKADRVALLGDDENVGAVDYGLQYLLNAEVLVGAQRARMEYTHSNIVTQTENTQASESTIRDADMAKEMTNYTKSNVLTQAAQSMLAQANQNSSAVLSLLQ